MNIPMVNMPKKEADPIGTEFSIDAGKFKKIKEYAVGDEVFLKVEGVIIGHHQHSIGGKPAQYMVDVKLTELEIKEEDEEEDEGEESDEGEE